MKKLLCVMAAAMISATAFEAMAMEGTANETPRVNARQYRQMHRIRQGVRSGELTKDEAKGLARDEKDLQQMKRDAKADGVVSPEERRKLHQALNAENRKIYREKHDAETR